MKKLIVVVLAAIAATLGLQLSCVQHTFYHGIMRRPKTDCKACALLYKALK